MKNVLLPGIASMLIVFATSCGDKPKYAGPLSPEESIKTFQFAEDFKAEVFAAEPHVIDPVSMEFDEQGDAYVVGMLDAYKPDSTKGKGTIVMLKDIDGDGRADTSIVFADHLREASSILPWKGGLLIAAAPNIMYYKDTTGDGYADLKEILFTGFFAKNEEAQISNLRFGVDNWIYANNNGQAGEISFTRQPDAPKLQVRGSDFRFRLDRNQFELTTGRGQFGLAMDDWGHRFFTQNSLHIQQAVIQKHYLARNPQLPEANKQPIVNNSDHDPLMYQLSETPYWRQERTNQRNKKFQENHLDRVEYARDHFTGASGGTYYGGNAFPAGFYGNIFTGDVAGGLVHRDVLTAVDTAPYLIAQRPAAEKSKEFMASTDTWFRPASLTTGPNGDLYVIDMYRQHIETPMSIPEDLQVGMDFDAGNRDGRIYRILPKNAPAYKKISPDLRNAPAAGLVGLLAHQNAWWRLTAQRLLLERHDKTVVPVVKALFETSADPRAKLHALYVLEGLDALDATLVKKAMLDSSAGLRENAAVLAERFPALLPDLEKMTADASMQVALQASLSVGEFTGQSVVATLAKVVNRYGSNAWFRTAVLSSKAGSSVELLRLLAGNNSFTGLADAWKLVFIEDLSQVIAARNQPAEASAVQQLVASFNTGNSAIWQSAVVKGIRKSKETAAKNTLAKQ